MKKIKIKPEELREIQEILKRQVPDCEVRAFGSRVTGQAKDYSDLDLAVIGKEALSLRRLGELREAFENSRLAFRVEALDWHLVSKSFRKAIEKEYVVLQEPAFPSSASIPKGGNDGMENKK